MIEPLDPTSLPLHETFELSETWQGRGIRAQVTFQNSYDEHPQTIQGRAYWNPKGHVTVRTADCDTLVPLSILRGIEKAA